MATPRIEVPAAEMQHVTALLISPIDEDHNTLKGIFVEQGWTLYTTKTIESASAILQETATFIVITERDLPVGNWKDVLKVLHRFTDPPLLVVSSLYANEYLWAEALNLGVYDVLAKPLVQAEVVRVLTSAWIQQLARQMQAAHRAYKEAAADYNKIRAKYGDMLDSVDGTFALRRAAENERRASLKYSKAVEAYRDMLSSRRVSGPPRETES
jgi:DNA-binding NtrC family response regulator